MWKINRLYLRNFVCIEAGMKKREVELDFTSCDKKINIFIGKMGSGKTSILGHLQPFADYGSLDPKNKLDEVIAEEEGLKEIQYEHQGDIFDIKHVYSWNKSTNSHSTKSFIRLNGEELNKNGNVNSFKELIKTYFGIDQSYLRLLRLGPNVANLINMKSTERKAFIATLLKDTEIYMMLSKKLGDDLRGINGTINVLNNRLIGLSSGKAKEMQAEVEDLEDDLMSLSKRRDQNTAAMARLQGINQTLMKGTRGDLQGAIEKAQNTLDEKIARFETVKEDLAMLPTEGVEELSVAYAKAVSDYNLCEEELLQLQLKSDANESERNKLTDEILLTDNTDQIAELERQCEQINAAYKRATQRLENYTPIYDYPFLANFKLSIENFQISLNEMRNNSNDVIKKCFLSDSSIIKWARKQGEIITATQYKYRKLLENIQFAPEYTCPVPLYRPPMCPTGDCPYIQTHPITIGTKNKVMSSIQELRNKLDSLERHFAIYSEYEVQYPKMQFLKDSWKIISGVLRKLGVLNNDYLLDLLINAGISNTWYDVDAFEDAVENAKLYEEYADMRVRANDLEREITELKKVDIPEKKRKLELLELEYRTFMEKIEVRTAKRDELKANKDRLTRILSNIGNRELLVVERAKLEPEIEMMKTSLFELQTREKQYEDNGREISVLQAQGNLLTSEYDQKARRMNTIKAQLQNIKAAEDSYHDLLEEARVLKLILSAVSAKEGIPLVMVKVFLEECQEIVNDLISDIFDDSLEIVNFDISDESNDFKIPYRINGNLVSDIEFASQGQQAVISIALSFALCRKAMFDYNIMLLDEIDNSIHKADRERFITILAKQMMTLGTEQVFLITHNDIFQQSGLPVNIIMTTPEVVDTYDNQTVMRIY